MAEISVKLYFNYKTTIVLTVRSVIHVYLSKLDSYVVILFSAILLSFRDNLSGVIALSTMAAGDGMADIIGRRFGKNNKWFFSESKSIAGSAGFVIASFLCSTLLSMWLLHTNSVAITMAVPALIGKILFISVVSAMVELFPVGDDNWSVPLTAGILSYLFIQ